MSRYTYCVCQRSIAERDPGQWCGPQLEDCPDPAPDFVDGVNNFFEGSNAQGGLSLAIAERVAAGEVDQEEAVCDNQLYSKLRFMFK